jgi:hypothetical protein
VLWLSAWLAELLGRDAEAIKRYGEFIDDCTSRYRRDASSDIPTERLDAPLEQAELLILARNNRAVLRLRQGRLTWLDDLVEAALRDFLPGACLSLLNLVDMAWNRADVHQVVVLVVQVVPVRRRPGRSRMRVRRCR